MGRNTNTPTDVFRNIDTHDNDPSVCWPWTGMTGGRDGRGYIQIEGKRQLVYRVVWEIFNGPIPEGMVIRHKVCDNPLCCNPTHLVVGTKSDNENDKYQADRVGYTHDMLREMRRMHKLGLSYVAIADKVNTQFGTTVSANGIGRVLRGDRRRQTNTD